MFKIYFGEWSSGKLKRLPYVGYYFLIFFLFAVLMFGSLFLMGGIGSIMNGDMNGVQEAFASGGGILATLLFIGASIAFMVAQFNIFAKRIRDMGLPVLWTIVGIIIFSIVLNVLFPPHEVAMQSTVIETANSTMRSASTTVESSTPVNIANLVIFLALIFVPSGTFGKRSE
ncbi:hypothetical protein MNB_SV-6-1361 [hydrothermal vent metagenome]|uniref:DUF805 domain-containing protein n=1 Tax=hydrothermal vent metagenome TaxID=652676 RepID=A0A1W1BXL0_9ZZZZ